MSKKRTVLLSLCVCLLVMGLCACAPKQQSDTAPSGDAGKDDGTVAVADWSPDTDCAVCHTAEQGSYENTQCIASKHPAVACTECHSATDKLADVHKGAADSGKMPKKLKKTEIPDDTCLTCHFGSKEKLAAATPDIALVDAHGTAVNPHQLSPSESHDSITCANCHSMHDTVPIEEKALKTCYGCHHEEVFECGTCHS